MPEGLLEHLVQSGLAHKTRLPDLPLLPCSQHPDLRNRRHMRRGDRARLFHHDSREHRCVGRDLNAYLVEGTSDIRKAGWETFIGASLVGEKQILSRERRHSPPVLAMVRIKPLTGDG